MSENTDDLQQNAKRRRMHAVYVISVAAELSGMHPQTLRIYERRGLVDPARTNGGSRRYSEEDILRLKRIQDLTNAGINLEGVRRIISLEEEVRLLKLEVARLSELVESEREVVNRKYRRDVVPFSHVLEVFTNFESKLKRDR